MNWLSELWKQLWITVVIAVVMLALYTSAGRQLVPLLETWKPDIEQWLSTQLGQEVRMDSMRGDWNGLSPIVHVTGLSIAGPDGIRVQEVEAELGVVASLMNGLPVFKQMNVRGVRSNGKQISERQWQIAPNWIVTLPERGEKKDDDRPIWLSLLEAQQSIYLSDWHLFGTDLKGEQDEVRVRKLHWRSKFSQRELRLDMAWGREQLANIRIDAYLDGDLWPWHQQNGRIYLEVDEQEWTRWIPDDLPSGIRVDQLRAGIKGWLTVQKGNLESVLLDATMPVLAMKTRGEPLVFTDGHVSIAGQHSGNDWHLRILPQVAEELPFTSLSLSEVQLPVGRGWQLGVPEVDIAQLRAFAARYNLLPPNIARYIEGTNPSGTATDVRLSLLGRTASEYERFDVRANLHQFDTVAFAGVPAFGNVDGTLHLQPKGGVVRTTGDDYSVHVADLYDQAWQVQNTDSVFRWHLYENHSLLLLENLQGDIDNQALGLPASNVKAHLSIEIPKQASPAESSLSLLLSLPDAPLAVRNQFIPNVVGPEIVNWMDESIKQGDAKHAIFVLKTRLGPPVNNASTTQLALQFDNASLQYAPEWPLAEKLSGNLLLNTPALDIWLANGESLGGELINNSGRVTLRPKGKHTELNVTARLEGKTVEALRYFTETPLQEMVGNAFDEWNAEGRYNANINLNMPLGVENSTPNITLAADVRNNRLLLNDLNLNIDNLTGSIRYNTKTGLSSPKINGELLGGQFQGSVRSTVNKQGAMRIVFNVKGDAQWQSFKDWQPLFLFDPIKGKLNYNGKITVADSQVTLDVESNLKGTEIKLPFPFGKAKNDSRAFAAQVKAGKPLTIRVDYDHLLNTVLALNEQGVERGQVMLGGAAANLPEINGIEVRGQLASELQGEEWWDTWLAMNKLVATETQKEKDAAAAAGTEYVAGTNPIKNIEVSLGEVNAWGMPMGITNINAEQQSERWEINVDSTLVSGVLYIDHKDAPLQAALNYVHFPQSEPSTTVVKEGEIAAIVQDGLANLNPHDFPAVDLTVGELFVGGSNYGAWSIQSRPHEHGLKVHITDTDIHGLHAKGDLYWQYINNQHNTRIENIKISSRDVGKLQRGFRLVPLVEGKDMDGTLDFTWSGSPVAFNTETLVGTASIRVRNGNVAAEGAGALKAFGALNFNSMARRLKLDFSDLYQSGVSFDVLRGKFEIKDNILTLSEPVVLDGPGGKFFTAGYTNLMTHELDMKLAVTFPVTGTLPLVAVLAGFAPPVAASIYVTERLIGDELARFTSASYDIVGTWEEPEMKMNKAFDDSVDGKQSRSFKQRVLSIFGLGKD